MHPYSYFGNFFSNIAGRPKDIGTILKYTTDKTGIKRIYFDDTSICFWGMLGKQ